MISSEHEQALIARWIVQHPQRGSAEARLADSGTPVWAIIGYLRAVGGDRVRASADYEVEPDAVDAAVAYYDRFPYQIDARLEANAEITA